MEALNLYKTQPIPLYPIDLPEFYSADYWDISTLDIYKNANDGALLYWKNYNVKDNCLDFTICHNLAIRKEIKYFFYSYIEINKHELRGLIANYSRMRHLISYINSQCLHLSSVTQIEQEDYENFLLENKLIESIVINSKKRINAKMEEVPTNIKNRTVTILGYIKNTVLKLYGTYTPEYDKDVWDVDNIPFHIASSNGGKKSLNFKSITQPLLKKQAKDFCYFKLKTLVDSTVHNLFHYILVFFKWLNDFHPEMQDLSGYSRDLLDEYFLWLRTESGKKEKYISSCILDLKIFIETGNLLEFEKFPKNSLITQYDYQIKKIKNPKYYSDNEIKNINASLEFFPKKYAKIVLCLEVLALRIGDLLSLKIENIKKTKQGYVLELVQGKTKRPLLIPLPESIYKLLISQYKESQEKFGKDVLYIFASSLNTHLSCSTVSRTVNKMFYEHKVLSDTGEILHFKSHKFRATKSTKLIQMGKGATEAAKVLGHSGLSSLSHYASVTDDTLIANMEPYLKKVELLVNNIGKVEAISEEDFKGLIPLCNGWCARPSTLGVCKHANYCLSCSLFKPDSRHLNTYSLHLEEVKAALAVATQDNNELLIQKLTKDKEQLERIIDEVKKLCQNQT